MKLSYSIYFLPTAFLLVLNSSGLAENYPSDSGAIGLPALVEQITRDNPEIHFYEAEIAAAKAGRHQAGRLSDPSVSLNLGRKTVRDSAGALAGEGLAWSVSVSQTFEWPGRLALRKAIANHDVELAELGLRRFESALAARARVLGYGLYAANTKAMSIREVTERFAALKETFLARDPAGITPLLETRVIEASELVLQRRASEAELAVQSALIELNLLRGVAAEQYLRVAALAPHLNAPPDKTTLVAAARENNFEYRIRRLELEQQGFQVRLARHELYPSVTVSPFFSQEKAGDKETTIGLGLSLPLPISARGKFAGEFAGARRRQADTAALLAQRDLERDVILAAQTLTTKLAEAGRWSPDSVEKFRDAAALADRHYRLGAVPIATYVELQNSYLDAVEALLDTQREALEASLRLEELTGLTFGGSAIPPREVAVTNAESAEAEPSNADAHQPHAASHEHAERGEHREHGEHAEHDEHGDHSVAITLEMAKALQVETALVEVRSLNAETRILAQVFTTKPQVLATASATAEAADALEKAELTNAEILRIDRAAAAATGRVEFLLALKAEDSVSRKSGDFVELVAVSAKDAACVVPSTAVLDAAEGTFVYRVSAEQYLRTPVNLGVRSGELVEVVDGLRAGDVVVIRGVEQLWLTELRLTKGGGHAH